MIQASGGCTEHTAQEHCQTSRLFSHFSAQNKKAHDPTIQRTIMSFSMPPTGVEPVLCLQKGILSPSCLPISPQRRKNPAYKALLLPQNERAGNNRSEVKIMAARPNDFIQQTEKMCGASFIAIFKNSADQNGIFAICSLRLLLVHSKRKLL